MRSFSRSPHVVEMSGMYVHLYRCNYTRRRTRGPGTGNPDKEEQITQCELRTLSACKVNGKPTGS